jgi:hypothetical protein
MTMGNPQSSDLYALATAMRDVLKEQKGKIDSDVANAKKNIQAQKARAGGGGGEPPAAPVIDTPAPKAAPVVSPTPRAVVPTPAPIEPPKLEDYRHKPPAYQEEIIEPPSLMVPPDLYIEPESSNWNAPTSLEEAQPAKSEFTFDAPTPPALVVPPVTPPADTSSDSDTPEWLK